MADRVDAALIKQALARRHLSDPSRQGRAWVYLTELRTRTGYGSERYIDAFALALWRSAAYERVAYEIKVSRSDWLAELKQPRKRDQAHWLSHRAYFVFAPGVFRWADIVDLVALDGWGVLEVQSDGTVREMYGATKREAWPMPETFIAALLRRAARLGGEDDTPLELEAISGPCNVD